MDYLDNLISGEELEEIKEAAKEPLPVGRPLHISTPKEAYKYLYRKLGARTANKILNAIGSDGGYNKGYTAGLIEGRRQMQEDLCTVRSIKEQELLRWMQMEHDTFSGKTCADMKAIFGIKGMSSRDMGRLLRQAGYTRRQTRKCGVTIHIWYAPGR